MLDQEHTACHYVLLTRQMVNIRGGLEQNYSAGNETRRSAASSTGFHVKMYGHRKPQ